MLRVATVVGIGVSPARFVILVAGAGVPLKVKVLVMLAALTLVADWLDGHWIVSPPE
jgi:type III secretory pathway component EscS